MRRAPCSRQMVASCMTWYVHVQIFIPQPASTFSMYMSTKESSGVHKYFRGNTNRFSEFRGHDEILIGLDSDYAGILEEKYNL